VVSRNSYAPLGDAASAVLLSEDDIERVVRRLLS
jgi:3-oxoacyl-[acyl-carrier-protein] synthase III